MINFFKKILGKTDTPVPILKEGSTFIDLIPEKLRVQVFPDRVSTVHGVVHCLTYMTYGLASLGQKELLFSVKTNGAPTKIIQDPLHFFKQVYQLAETGLFVNNGGITMFGDRDLLGWKGIIYSNLNHKRDLKTGHDYLVALLVSKEELEATSDVGYLRILSMLGEMTRFYPSPFWSDINRHPLPIASVIAKSIVSKIQSIILYSSTVTLENNIICWRLSKNSNVTNKVKDKDKPFVVFPSLEKTANACLTLDMTNKEPAAISPDGSDGSKMGACFLIINPEQPQNDTKLVEDGFYIALNSENWQALWLCLTQEQSLFVSSDTQSMNFSVQWV
ncbi:DUF3480 domain-containing protein [Cytophagaceae bacterium YF14B1]|uniref:DUF3480 domain-containing protein n=1 Tax=Xanthocytophaga flava TaxID=3048013 RepID=A0AAE3QSC0_9BACT|nr:DUF3480 domain-containing protein [Xanthocytophaga flavus]MDJ1484041.1 DUF3480 domain-containing protein [Xanthocytophaga flavus]